MNVKTDGLMPLNLKDLRVGMKVVLLTKPACAINPGVKIGDVGTIKEIDNRGAAQVGSWWYAPFRLAAYIPKKEGTKRG